MMGRTRGVLRAVAIAIAMAGAIDPAAIRARAPALDVAVVTAVSAAHDDDADAVVAAMRLALGERARLDVRAASAVALPCGVQGACVVVADGSRSVVVPRDRRGPTSLVTVPSPGEVNVAVSAVAPGTRQHPGASGVVRARVEGRGVAGRTSVVRVLDQGVEVGRIEHRWRVDGVSDVAVPWWPVSDGPRALGLEVSAAEGEADLDDNHADVGAWVTPARTRVLVFEPRASWATAFVRRALDRDPRLVVDSRTRVAPGVAVSTAGAGLEISALQRASAVVVGGLDALGPGEVELLDRYVRVRGGTLVLLPDRRPVGRAARLLRGEWTEHLQRAGVAVGQLRASEILRLGAPGPADLVLARDAAAPVVVMTPAGEGRIVVSGAMDAWRFRAEGDGAFDRFWRGLVAEVGPYGDDLSIETDALAAVGERVPVRVRWRAMTGAAGVRAGASVACDSASSEPIRLWPSGQPGVFEGEWAAGSAGACLVEAVLDGHRRAAAGVVVVEAARRARAQALAGLVAAVDASGGARVPAGRESELARSLLSGVEAAPELASTHPLRSPWWMVPFAACLGGEWWLRRRAGLR